MMLKYELQKHGRSLGFNLGQTEIDYLQHLFLSLLSHHSAEHLVFKGGTALQKAYGLPRFSIDLDFTAAKKTSSLELMKTIGKEIEHFGNPTKIEEVETLGETFILKINGPLSGAGPMSIASLRIEISQRESLLLKPLKIEVNPGYPDLKPYTVLVMAEKEILAEKIRAIMTRNKPRDVFDLYFLLNKKVNFDLQFVNTKLAYYQEVFEKKKFIEKVKEKQIGWEKELNEYCHAVPDFKKVLILIDEKIS